MNSAFASPERRRIGSEGQIRFRDAQSGKGRPRTGSGGSTDETDARLRRRGQSTATPLDLIGPAHFLTSLATKLFR